MQQERAVLAAAVTQDAVVAVPLTLRVVDDLFEFILQLALEGLQPFGKHPVIDAVVTDAFRIEADTGVRRWKRAARAPFHRVVLFADDVPRRSTAPHQATGLRK